MELERVLDFPPFYTLQVHEETKQRQIQLWCQRVLEWCKSHRIRKLDVTEAATSSELFSSPPTCAVKRSINTQFINIIMDSLIAQGRAEKVTDTSFMVFSVTLDDYAQSLYQWVERRSAQGIVMTVSEIIRDGGSGNEDELFFGMEIEMFRKVVAKLEADGKVLVIKDGLRLRETDGLKFK